MVMSFEEWFNKDTERLAKKLDKMAAKEKINADYGTFGTLGTTVKTLSSSNIFINKHGEVFMNDYIIKYRQDSNIKTNDHFKINHFRHASNEVVLMLPKSFVNPWVASLDVLHHMEVVT